MAAIAYPAEELTHEIDLLTATWSSSAMPGRWSTLARWGNELLPAQFERLLVLTRDQARAVAEPAVQVRPTYKWLLDPHHW